jgi:hypothetical protein
MENDFSGKKGTGNTLSGRQAHLLALDAGDSDIPEGALLIRAQPQLLSQGHAASHNCARQHAAHAPHLKRLIHLQH